MSATNATANYELPLFIGADKPTWLTDWNGTMNAIDTAIANVASSAGGTATDLAALTLSVSGLSSTVSEHTTSITTLTTAVNGNTGSINTINSLIGNGEPTTTDKTIIGAINELHADISGQGTGVLASAVSYDNQTSGLTASTVQAAIDEVVGIQGDLADLQTTVKTSLVAAINEAAQSGGSSAVTPVTALTFTTNNTSQQIDYDLDDYNFISICVADSSNERVLNAVTLPIAIFKNLSSVRCGNVSASGSTVTPYFVTVEYVDATHLTVSVASSIPSGTGGMIILY